MKNEKINKLVVNFGKCNTAYTNFLTEIISSGKKVGVTENNKPNSSNDVKEVFNNYINLLRENKVLKTQYHIYSNIELKVESDKDKALEFVKENLSLMNKFSIKEISETKIEDSTVGSEIINEIKGIDIYTPGQYQALSGLSTAEQAKEGSFYTKENIRKHREYLKRKGINTSTREEIINDLNKYVGKGDRGDGTPYKQEDVDLFINKLGTFVLFDGDAKITEPKPFVSYDPSNNNSLIPIYAKQLGSQLKVESKEDLQKGNIQTNDLDVD